MNNLVEFRPAPVPAVVELLRDLLAMAESGELIGIAVAAACTGRAVAHGVATGEAVIADLYLGIERAKRKLLEVGEE